MVDPAVYLVQEKGVVLYHFLPKEKKRRSLFSLLPVREIEFMSLLSVKWMGLK